MLIGGHENILTICALNQEDIYWWEQCFHCFVSFVVFAEPISCVRYKRPMRLCFRAKNEKILVNYLEN